MRIKCIILWKALVPVSGTPAVSSMVRRASRNVCVGGVLRKEGSDSMLGAYTYLLSLLHFLNESAEGVYHNSIYCPTCDYVQSTAMLRKS